MPRKGDLKGVYVPCENCGKILYRTPYRMNKNTHQFCSNQCQMEYEHKQRFEDRKCEVCGKVMHLSKLSTQRFCSELCQHEWQKTRVGDLNPKTKRVEVQCDWCGKMFTKTPSVYALTDRHFCSNECRRNWYAKVLSQQDSWKAASRDRCLNMLAAGEISHTNTKPQIIVNDILTDKNIKFENEHICGFYSLDNYLLESNLAIEVMGDFWHASPLKYNIDNLYPNQRKAIGRDKAKRTYAKKYYDMDILYLWEDDLYKRVELCAQLIDVFIDSGGEMPNYHSFNYYINDNAELNLRSEIIIPYQEQPLTA